MLRSPSGKERDPIGWQISPGIRDIPASVAPSRCSPAISASLVPLSFAERRATAQKRAPFPPKKPPLSPHPLPSAGQVQCEYYLLFTRDPIKGLAGFLRIFGDNWNTQGGQKVLCFLGNAHHSPSTCTYQQKLRTGFHRCREILDVKGMSLFPPPIRIRR